MRTDEGGNPCPETLEEYRSLCLAIGRVIGIPNNRAVLFLDKKIAESPNGGQEKVVASDSQMRAILMPWLLESGQ